jgi:hypothetical protein
MPPDLANQFNPLPCQADFTYAMTPKTIEIQDTGKGKKSVADDLEAVLLKIEYGTRARSLATTSVTGALREPSTRSSGTGQSLTYQFIVSANGQKRYFVSGSYIQS